MRVQRRDITAIVRPAITSLLVWVACALPAAAPVHAQSEAVDCTGASAGARVRPGTYVALGKDLLFRLQVERALGDAVVIVNKVDGNRLYDRVYWKPVKLDERCGQRTVDYVDEEAQGTGAPVLRLVLEPAEEVRRPGQPRGTVVFKATAVLPSGERQALQFEEVIIKREVGGGPAKK